MEYLASNPSLIQKMAYVPKELAGLCKQRVGNWRILFWTDHSKKIITLYSIEHRKDIYKNL